MLMFRGHELIQTYNRHRIQNGYTHICGTFIAYESTSFFCYEAQVHTHLHSAKEGYFVGCALAGKRDAARPR